ncbi:stretch-activated Ca2+-permeable channel component-domain-containing protein [Auriculariales sp. MPI-PUGE-AT-0066]|nr:stretch-activated Ca2+-permeable channel component-domain-containing protein [Auriculariales sp. MPI-PUGE-AT-0066]
MLPHSLLLLLAPLLLPLLCDASGLDYDILGDGHMARARLGVHLALSPSNTEQSDTTIGDGWSYKRAIRQRRFMRIPPTTEPVTLVYALCTHDDNHDIRLLRGATAAADQSDVRVLLHAARQGETLDAVQQRVVAAERIYDEHWMPIYPHELDDWTIDGSGTWEGVLPWGGILDIQVSHAWVEGDGEGEDMSLDRRWDSLPVDAHFDFEVEQLEPRARRPFNESDPLGLPLLGDTTGTMAIIFSPPFAGAPTPQDQGLSISYPNYSLPLINPAPNQQRPPAPPTFRLVLHSTNHGTLRTRSLDSPAHGSCATRRLAARQGNGPAFEAPAQNVNATSTVVLRGNDGWRVQWIVEGLNPNTNYTASVVTPTGQTTSIYLVTKSADFACPLVHSLPYCPAVAYAVPLDAPAAGDPTTYSADGLPLALTQPLLDVMGNFSKTLGSFACGLDWWSPVHTCSSCFEAYRNWVCGLWFPRCSEPTRDAPAPTIPLTPSITRPAALRNVAVGQLPRTPVTELFPDAYPKLNQQYSTVLPCLETCQAVERACPPFVQFQCPRVSVNANESYGVGYVDFIKSNRGGASFILPDDEQKRLRDLSRVDARGVEADVYGNRWCAGDVVINFVGPGY